MIRSRTGRCVVFDLDDTLYDEIDFVRSGFTAVADAGPESIRGRLRIVLDDRFENGQLDAAFQGVIRQYHLPEGALAFMVEVYRAPQAEHPASGRCRGGAGRVEVA